MRLLLGALLNLVPGFGFGYLVAGRTQAFRLSLLGWALPAAGTVFGFIGAYRCQGGLECLGWLTPLIGAPAVGILLVNLPGTLHLLVLFVMQPRRTKRRRKRSR
jgi:hypothetical protein